jgi:molybdopterin-containing oxidoreductase family iron-sulfur binding subunit
MSDGPVTSAGRMPLQGRRYWRSLEEIASSEDFKRYLETEFPDEAAQWLDPLSRRQFLTLMAASFALAGVAGCSTKPAPPEKIMPYVRQPEEMIPGRPLFFASAMPLAGVASGIVVESHEGRPTKIEGNQKHPASLGATDAWTQASVLGLYDPDRSQLVTYRGRPRAWNEAVAAIRAALQEQRDQRGAGLRLLSGAVSSPTLVAQIESLLREYPEARWHQYEATGGDRGAAAAQHVFGKPLDTIYDFSKADVILSLDADFLGCGPGHLRYVRDFISRRRIRTNGSPLSETKMARLYAAECMPSSTGAKADHRLPLRHQEMGHLVAVLAAELGANGAPEVAPLLGSTRKWMQSVADDLRSHRGSSIIIGGDSLPVSVLAMIHALNSSLGNTGKTVVHVPAIRARQVDFMTDLKELASAMAAGRVNFLAIIGTNPVFTSPADIDFAKALRKVQHSLHLGLYHDETAVLCNWHIPEAHYLEAWGDCRAYDGTVSIIQPLIAPLYNGKSAYEFLALLGQEPERLGQDIVRGFWRKHRESQGQTSDFERFWQVAVQEGVVPGTAFRHEEVSLKEGWAKNLPKALEIDGKSDSLDIAFRPDPTVFDGRFANNGWLQELPKPLTKLTWDNAALMSPRTAAMFDLNVEFGWQGGEHGQAEVDVIELSYQGRTITAPAWIVPGHADDAITIHFGYGRQRAGRVGNDTGFNAYRIRTSDHPWSDTGLRIRKTGERYVLACTQMHHAMNERAPVHSGTLEEFKAHPDFAQKMVVAEHLEPEVRQLVPGPHEQPAAAPVDRRLVPLTLYPQQEYEGYKWGMAIDLTACVGCNACVVACQAENNIPVVGKSQVIRAREMHWLRIDRYYVGDINNPEETFFQPVPCMHCEKAPCELVCPVGATTHSDDGLNDMVYNRCVGTRYCSNNCPYKVRRFNFLEYANYATTSLKLQRNPNVTVRSRGVMEKCTYCVQRIRSAEISAETEDRRIRDHEVLTACQAACPAQAIVFGDLNDKNSQVLRWKSEPLNYALLQGLGTQPRTTYLASLRNPNPLMS